MEFALVLPVFLLILFGAVEFGRAFLDLHLLNTAARRGARMGALPQKTETDVSNAIDTFLVGAGMSAGSWGSQVIVTDRDGDERAGGLATAENGDHVYVTVSYDFQVLIGSIVPSLTGTIQLQGKCVFRRE